MVLEIVGRNTIPSQSGSLAILEEKITSAVMEWVDLKQLDTLIQQTKVLGADIEEIGVLMQ
jgi:hypothetical protein